MADDRGQRAERKMQNNFGSNTFKELSKDTN
jgi:hypothetical protein